MTSPQPGDPTPESPSPTDPSAKTLAREKTGAEEAAGADWNAIAATSEFKALLAAKAAFIVPTTIFFIIYYFALPILVGWFPDLMKTKIGSVNLAYVFALSQFFMAWIVAGLYVLKATGWDKSAAQLLAKFKH